MQNVLLAGRVYVVLYKVLYGHTHQFSDGVF